MKELTVGDLVEKLQALNRPELVVETEGCDCYGDVGEVSIVKFGDESDEIVMLWRTDGEKREEPESGG